MRGGRGVHTGGGEKSVFVKLTHPMSTSTVRGSTCTEFYRSIRCIRGVIVKTSISRYFIYWVITQVGKVGGTT